MSSSPTPSAAQPWRFIIVVIVVAVAISFAVGYFGLTGQLGGTIPGTRTGHAGPPPPPSCEGGGKLGTFHFIFVAGVGGGFNFNGSQPGPCVLIANGSWVNVTFVNSPAATANHSWVLIPAGAGASALPAFPGAGFNNSTRTNGIPPGAEANFTFHANVTGAYQYICEVPGHEALGMLGWFNVTASAAAAAAGSGAAPASGTGTGSAAASRVLTEPT